MATPAPSDLTVLVADDDFRVADLHAGIVEAMAGFAVAGTANTLVAARDLLTRTPVDLALVDVYFPDGSGIDLVHELHCDSMVLTASTDTVTVRAAVSGGALGYLVKPFPPTELATRLAGYARYRRLLSAPQVDGASVATALRALHPPSVPSTPAMVATSPTKDLVLHSIIESGAALSAAEAAAAIGISRATAQRYLATLVGEGIVRMRLRYGSTGRPEQEYFAPAR
ncbi:response regulator [Nocardia callitridis]|uniref:Transcriptional regulatory protein n=1 Tax=Nocardia callitridis TaxID=648753 RepID=A0ABP9KM87_9NOCA